MKLRTIDMEINERVSKLGDEQKQQVLQFVRNLETETFDYAGWWQRIERRQAEIRTAQGGDLHINVADLLRQVREDED